MKDHTWAVGQVVIVAANLHSCLADVTLTCVSSAICWVPLHNWADSLTEQVQAGICEESDGRDKRPACDGAKSQVSAVSFIFADGHIFYDCLMLGLCNVRVHIVAKRVSPGKTISEG